MTARTSWLAVFLASFAVPAVQAACVDDGQVVVRTGVSQQVCEAAQPHLPNAACCSGTATPVWNPSSPVPSKMCEFVCDATDHCIGVVCTALDDCHLAGTCDSATGLCSNILKPDGSVCEDGNACTSGDTCDVGFCLAGFVLPGCCGDGAVDAGEQCDDGNQTGLDGCTPSCALDPFWECVGQPSQCCPGTGAVRFTVANFLQVECEAITMSGDAACCDGVHKGQWTGTTCNIVCATDLCARNDVVCQAKDACHLTGLCDPAAGVCSDPVGPVGAPCGEPATTACSGPDHCDAQGDCLPNDAPAGEPCLTASQCSLAQCNGSGGCVDAVAVTDGVGCNDADACTTADRCVAGQCAGTSVTCQPSEPCRVGTCHSRTGCTSALAAAGTACGTGVGGCTNRCDAAGNCEPCVTTSTIPGPPSTTTTLPVVEPCDAFVGLARAACVIRAALAEGVCGDELVPTKVDRALRRRLGKAAGKLDVAAASNGGKRTRLLKRVDGKLTTVERQAGKAATSNRPSQRISSSCEAKIGGLVGTTRADIRSAP